MDFQITIHVPDDHAADFAACLTGNDDDVILAGETAMRERVGRRYGVGEMELELSLDSPEDIQRTLYAASGN